MADKRIPQGGLRKPPAKRYPVTSATSCKEHVKRLHHGRIRIWHTRENRCLQEVQVGAAAIYVTNDFGVLALVELEPRPWY